MTLPGYHLRFTPEQLRRIELARQFGKLSNKQKNANYVTKQFIVQHAEAGKQLLENCHDVSQSIGSTAVFTNPTCTWLGS